MTEQEAVRIYDTTYTATLGELCLALMGANDDFMKLVEVEIGAIGGIDGWHQVANVATEDGVKHFLDKAIRKDGP